MAKNGDRIYAVYELLDRGSIATYSVDCAGGLTAAPPGGYARRLDVSPSIDIRIEYLTATNYWTGSMVVCPIDEDGIVRTPVCVKQYAGKSVNPQRQEGPHTHFYLHGPFGNVALMRGTGMDRIYRYTFDPATGCNCIGCKRGICTDTGRSGPQAFCV